ncbi:MAG: DNA repair and recombination protein RadA [Promethearchaeota archaeon]
MIGLNELKGIKPRQIKILMENGILSVESLAMSNPSSLAELDGISEKSSKSLVWTARNQLGLGTFKPVSELNENFEFITTGSKNLDEILGGGISTGRITEVFGAFKSGKTNLAHTLCVTTQLRKEDGGLGGAVLFIDTENTFSKSKIRRISRRFGVNPDEILANIYHARIYSSDHQIQMIQAAEAAVQDKGARLIIIDSLMALLRSEYIGIGLLARRQQLLNTIIHDLSRLAETYNIAVLVTNQVATVMKGTYAAEDAIGGNIVAHGCHYRIQFKAKGFSMNSSLERTATIVDAPDLPPESTQFFITEAGIADSETIVYPDEENKKNAKKNKSKKGNKKFSLVSAAELENDSQIGEKSTSLSNTDKDLDIDYEALESELEELSNNLGDATQDDTVQKQAKTPKATSSKSNGKKTSHNGTSKKKSSKKKSSKK